MLQAVARARRSASVRNWIVLSSHELPAPERWPLRGTIPIPDLHPNRSPLEQHTAFRAIIWHDILTLLDPVYEVSHRDDVCTYAELAPRPTTSSKGSTAPPSRHAIWLHDAGPCLEVRTYATDSPCALQTTDAAGYEPLTAIMPLVVPAPLSADSEDPSR